MILVKTNMWDKNFASETSSEFPQTRILENGIFIADECAQLMSLAYSLERVGSDKLASEIRDTASSIKVYVERIQEDSHQCVTELLRSSENSTTNMMKAVIAGLSIGKEF